MAERMMFREPTKQLFGWRLDAAVAFALKLQYRIMPHVKSRWVRTLRADGKNVTFAPTTEWRDAGPLIVKYEVMIGYQDTGGEGKRPIAQVAGGSEVFASDTALDGAMRALAHHFLGEMASVPESHNWPADWRQRRKKIIAELAE